GSEDVDIDEDIIIKFSHPIDEISVIGISPIDANLIISPPVSGREYEWDSDLKTLTIRVSDDKGYFQFCTEYEVIVKAGIKDTYDINLDTDLDCIPGGPDTVFRFRTRGPEIEVTSDPPRRVIKIGESGDYKIEVKNQDPLPVRMDFSVIKKQGSGGWEYSPESFSLEIGAEGEGEQILTVRNNGVEDEKDSLVLKIIGVAGCTRESTEIVAIPTPKPPIVIKTEPKNKSKNVPVDKEVVIEFSLPMDRNATERAVSIEPGRIVNKRWENSTTLVLETNLEYCKRHIVTVSDKAMSEDSVHLDGDKDGKEGGEYQFWFVTEKPYLTSWIEPAAKWLLPGEEVTHTIYVKGPEKKDIEVEISGELLPMGLGWSVSGIPFSGKYIVPAQGTWRKGYTVQNVNAIGSMKTKVKTVYWCEEGVSGTYIWCEAIDHAVDHPDDTPVPPGSPDYPSEIVYDPPENPSPVGIFLTSWGEAVARILGRYKIPVCGVTPDLEIVPDLTRPLSDLKVILISSAGLTKVRSPYLQERFKEFVENGGVIITFTTHLNKEWGFLPIPEGETLSGYGWNGDISCFANAVYLSEWHPSLCGVKKVTPSMNVDGFFTKWPSGAIIPLKRTKNDRPAVVIYPYGKGWVVVTSLYTDWTYGHGGSGQEELAFIRDLVTWAMAPHDSIPVVKEGEPVTVNCKIKNSGDIAARKAIIKVYSPDRESLSTLHFTLLPSLNPGDSTVITFNYTAPSYLGIYPVEYLLLSPDGDTIQPPKMGGRFGVRLDLPVGYYHTLFVDIFPERKEVVKGDTVNVRFRLINKRTEYFEGKLKIDMEEHGYVVRDTVIEVTIPPLGEDTLYYPVKGIKHHTFVRAQLFMPDTPLEFRYAVARSGKYIFVVPPEVGCKVLTEEEIYGKGDTVKIFLRVKNNAYLPAESLNFAFFILNPEKETVFVMKPISWNVVLPESIVEETMSYIIPEDAPWGEYECIFKGSYTMSGYRYKGYGRTTFQVPSALFTVTPVIPGTLHIATENEPGFMVKNIWKTDAQEAILTARLVSPEKEIVWETTDTFDLPSYSETLLVYSVPWDSGYFGKYKWRYHLVHHEVDMYEIAEIPNTFARQITSDKELYNAGDTLEISFWMKNTGMFAGTMQVYIEVPDADFHKSYKIFTAPKKEDKITAKAVIPEDIMGGVHEIVGALCTSRDKIYTKGYFTVVPSDMYVYFDETYRYS
ncbi:hypothetical protein DRQ18_05970, partial [bacterium]